MLKAIQSIQEKVQVTTRLGSDIDSAKKECQFLATILRTNVELIHNDIKLLIDSEGNCIQQNNQIKDLMDLSARG